MKDMEWNESESAETSAFYITLTKDCQKEKFIIQKRGSRKNTSSTFIL